MQEEKIELLYYYIIRYVILAIIMIITVAVILKIINTKYYPYDENEQIIGMNYNGARYYYIKNAQNDIVGILDSNLN